MQKRSKFVSLRGGRNFLRPTRQSLTERFASPERSLEKQSKTVCVLQARHSLVPHVTRSRASPRNPTPPALRLPRRFAPRNDMTERFCGHTVRFSETKVLNSSLMDTTTVLPRKRHFTRTQARISHAKHISLAQHISLVQRANFTAQPTAPSTKSFAGGGFAGCRTASPARSPQRSRRHP